MRKDFDFFFFFLPWEYICREAFILILIFQLNPLDTVHPWLNLLDYKKSLKMVKNQRRDRDRAGPQAKEMLLQIRQYQKAGLTPE